MAEGNKPIEEALFGDLADDRQTKQVAVDFSSLGRSVEFVHGSGAVQQVKTKEDFARELGVDEAQLQQLDHGNAKIRPKGPPIRVDKIK